MVDIWALGLFVRVRHGKVVERVVVNHQCLATLHSDRKSQGHTWLKTQRKSLQLMIYSVLQTKGARELLMMNRNTGNMRNTQIITYKQV